MAIGLDPVINGGKGNVLTDYAAGVTTIVLDSGDGANFPSTYSYNLVWYDHTLFPDPADDPNAEIIRVTNRSTDTLTIVRGQEGTADVNHTSSNQYKVVLSITKKMIDDIDDHAHGISDADDYTESAIADGEVLRYTGSGGWVNNTIDELITDINQLGNVTITSVAANEILRWSGSAWINRTYVEAGIAASGGNGDITSLSICTNIDAGASDLNITANETGEVVINDAQEDVNFRVEGSSIDDLFFCDAGNEVVGIGTNTPSVNADLTLGINGVLCGAETTTPTADTNFWKIYSKTDDKLYFQDGGGVEHEIAFV